ncbi:MAG: 23S rRNA (guanosine(2251)-2'-O)-methyltransferase RlmB [Bacillota bacterium]
MRARKDSGLIHIFGKQPVQEAVTGGWPVREILVRGKIQDEFIRSVTSAAKRTGIPIVCMEPPAFDRRFARASQGMVAIVKDVESRDLDEVMEGIPKGRPPFFVALDGIEDPHNLGAITRTAYAMGVDAVVTPRRRSASIGEGAAKSSAGAIFKQPICQVANLNYFIEWAKDRGLWVYGLDAQGKDTLWDTDFRGGVALVVGSEGRGISRLVRERCDFLVRIPMSGSIGSLNASVAAAMAIMEVQRQRTRGVNNGENRGYESHSGT